MQFGLDKCAVVIMKRGKIVKSEGRELPNDEKIIANIITKWR